MLVSVVVLFYNEEESLKPFYDAITQVIDSVERYEFELVFSNDGSKDQSVEILQKIMINDSRVKIVDLSRNYGKETALLAGLDHAEGDAVIMMDSDLQHPPYLIPEFLKWWEQGYDDIYATRQERVGEPWLKKKTSELYYKILQGVTEQGVEIYPNAGDFRLLDRKVVDALIQLREQSRYMKGMYGWVGFRKKEIFFDAAERVGGTTKFNFKKLMKLAIDGVTSFTTAPLTFAAYIGSVFALFGFVYGIIILIQTIFLGKDVPGFPSIMTAVLFLGGLQLITLGIAGTYIGKIFYESKNRPLYFVEDFLTAESMKKRSEGENDDIR